MNKIFAVVVGAVGIVIGGRAAELIPLPLSLTQTNPFVWTNALWWTNSYYTNSLWFTNEFWFTNAGWKSNLPAGLETWQAWWAARENMNRLAQGMAELEGGLADADTNSIVNSPTAGGFSTNSFTSAWGTTNELPWSITNIASLSYKVQSGMPVVLWSTNGGAAWHKVSGWMPAMIGVTKIALTDADHYSPVSSIYPIPVDSVISNVVVQVQTRPDLFGKTNQVLAQRLLVDYPAEDHAAANKGYVDALYNSTAWWSAPSDVQLNGHGLHLNNAWKLQSGTNALRASFLGNESFSVAYSMPVAVTNSMSVVMADGTNLVVTVATNGLAGAPALEISHYLSPPNWEFSQSVPALIGTNWVFTLGQPWTDSGFLMAVIASADPGVFSLATVLQLAPKTILAADGTTWGHGAGLVCVDSSYVYVSVGTNSWRRSALTTW